MTRPNNVKDLPTADQGTLQQLIQDQHQTVMARLTSMQQNAAKTTATMQQFTTTVTRQLADPLAPIESIIINRRTPTDDPAPQNRVNNIHVNEAVNDSNFERICQNCFDEMAPASRNRLFAMIRTRNDVANGADASASAQISELKDTQKPPRSSQVRTTGSNSQNPAREPDSAQENNESGEAESSSAAREREKHSGAAPQTTFPPGIMSDDEVARALQKQLWEEDFSDGTHHQTTPDRAHMIKSEICDQVNDEEDDFNQELDDQVSSGKRKRDKGKGRAIDERKAKSSRDAHRKSRASSTQDPSIADNDQTDAADTTAQVAQPRRKSQRKIEIDQRKRNESEERKTKREQPDQTPSKIKMPRYRDPTTGMVHIGWVATDVEPTKQMGLPPDPEPRRRPTKGAQPPATSKTWLATELDADQTTNTHESQERSERAENLSRNEDSEDSDAPDELGRGDEDSSEAEIPDHDFDQSFINDMGVPGPREDDDEEDDPSSDEDGVEARHPYEAHRYRKHPDFITKHNNSRQPTTAHNNRYKKSSTSWVGTPVSDVDGSVNRPTPLVRAGEKRRTEVNDQTAEADGKSVVS